MEQQKRRIRTETERYGFLLELKKNKKKNREVWFPSVLIREGFGIVYWNGIKPIKGPWEREREEQGGRVLYFGRVLLGWLLWVGGTEMVGREIREVFGSIDSAFSCYPNYQEDAKILKFAFLN